MSINELYFLKIAIIKTFGKIILQLTPLVNSFYPKQKCIPHH